MDDFGRGFASLSQAQRYPFSILKLDRAYVQSPDHVIAAAVATLGGALGMEMIPEGIETEAQARGLQDLGCTLGQGYLFGRPQPAAEISALLVR